MSNVNSTAEITYQEQNICCATLFLLDVRPAFVLAKIIAIGFIIVGFTHIFCKNFSLSLKSFNKIRLPPQKFSGEKDSI